MKLHCDGRLSISEEPVRFNVVAVGDCLPGGRIENTFISGNGDRLLGEVRELFSLADQVLFNLEAPLCRGGSPIPKCGPNFRVSPQVASGLKKSGFTLAALANNHIFDYGPEGLSETLKALESVGIMYHGAGNTVREATRPLTKVFNGMTVTFLNYAEGEFSRLNESGEGAAPLDPITNIAGIQKAKEQSDFVVLTVHAGNEFMHFPSPRTQQLYRQFITSGADLVVAHHPHIPQGIEFYKHGAIAYSLGDFFFEHGDDRGTCVTFAIQANFGKKGLSSLTVHPVRKNPDASLSLLKAGEKELFINHLNRISEPLTDQSALKTLWEQQVIRRFESFYFPKLKKNIHRIRSLASYTSSPARFFFNMLDCPSHLQALKVAFRLIYTDNYSKTDTIHEYLHLLDHTLSILEQKDLNSDREQYYKRLKNIYNFLRQIIKV